MSFSRRDFLRNLSIAGLAGVAGGSPRRTAAFCSPESGVVLPSGFITLDRNENAYGPSAKVIEAIRAASEKVNDYPREQAAQLVDRIAEHYKVEPAQIILGAGSTEILRVACQAFLGKGKQLIQPVPTYPEVEAYARPTGATIISDPLTSKFEFDFDTMLGHRGSGLVYICNPNNPTGTINTSQHLAAFLAKLPASYKVLADEAYYEFCPRTTSTSSFLDHPLDDRTIVTRTFSLAYGLAGLRVGFGVASRKLVEQMRPFLSQNSVNSVALRAASAALEDTDGLAENVRRNLDARQQFYNVCTARSIKPLDSHANFFAFNIYNPANLIISYFRENNILIAPVSLSWDSYIRVSLGKPEDMRTFWQVWDKAPIDKSSIRH
jgi:histidinol-phosphate aminotransferase